MRYVRRIKRENMKALSITPSRWFNPVFEVPVIRRIPRCRQAFPVHAQPTPLRRRRRLHPLYIGRCANRHGPLSQHV
jgi:hypothetical protein